MCIKSARKGRSLSIEPRDVILRRHRAWMATDEVREVYRRRQQLVNPVFGIVKDQQRARRFLLRGLMNVAAEWTVLAAAFNLPALWRVWRSRTLTFFTGGPQPQPAA